MSLDTQFSTSYNLKPHKYVPGSQKIQAILGQKLLFDMLADVHDYMRFVDGIKEQISPETESDSRGRIPSKYYLDELKSSEGKIFFKDEYILEVELSKENGLFFFQNVKFNIFGSGFTKEEALKDFSEFFIHDYLSYKNSPPKDLTQDARQLLKEYESVISTFESA